ncbi:hypothetical protein BH10BAC4_BH10BAC4_19080 [soil metagenome]
MLGIIAAIVISWLLLWLLYRQNLSALGIAPSLNHLQGLVIGFSLSGVACSLYFLLQTTFIENNWIVRDGFTIRDFLSGGWWTVKSVLFEELIFRGALLYLAIQKIGERKACILSACSFGVYHWFSYGAFGSPVQMAIVFVMTSIPGLAFAFSFAKTKSLYLPVGLHFGWNLFTIVIFSSGPLGKQFLLKETDNRLEGILSLLVFIFQIAAIPLITYFYLRWLNRKQVDKIGPAERR